MAHAQHEARLCVFAQKVFSSPLAMSYTAPLTTPGTCTPSLSLTQFFLTYLTYTSPASFKPCADPRRPPSGALAERPPLTGYEPKQLAEFQDLSEHEDLRVKPLFFYGPSIAPTYGSAESIVTPPPDSDLDDEQIRALLASPLYIQELRKAPRTADVPLLQYSDTTVDVPVVKQRRGYTTGLHDEVQRNPDGQKMRSAYLRTENKKQGVFDCESRSDLSFT